MKKIHDINEGYTFDYAIPALFILIIGGLSLIIHFAFSIFFFLWSVYLFCLRSGIEIDFNHNCIRIYKSLFNSKSGEWIDLKNYGHLDLIHTNEAVLLRTRGTEMKSHANTYDLYFKSDDDKIKYKFHEFSDYKTARSVLDLLVDELSYTYFDEVEEMRKKAKIRSRYRRR